MEIDLALRLTEILLSFAVLQQSLEHLAHRYRWDDPLIFLARILLCLPLALGIYPGLAVWGLWVVALLQLWRYQGPYNGGSDKMTVLILSCLSLYYLAPDRFWQEMALSYLAVQLVLSYFVSGWIKIINPVWRRGEALRDVFRFSAYPVSEALRRLADQRLFLFLMGWAVMLLEVAFPLTLLHPLALKLALVSTAVFHFSNACFFGLNRFFWIWLCAYPSLIWFQGRVFAGF